MDARRSTPIQFHSDSIDLAWLGLALSCLLIDVDVLVGPSESVTRRLLFCARRRLDFPIKSDFDNNFPLVDCSIPLITQWVCW